MMYDENIISFSAAGLSGPDVTRCHSKSAFFTQNWAQFLGTLFMLFRDALSDPESFWIAFPFRNA
jgi:hypothetical protein